MDRPALQQPTIKKKNEIAGLSLITYTPLKRKRLCLEVRLQLEVCVNLFLDKSEKRRSKKLHKNGVDKNLVTPSE